MFLTRMYLNPQREASRKALSNVNCLHAQVLNAFGPDTPKKHPLWRVDHEKTRNTLYVVSSVKPDMRAFHENFGWESNPPLTADYTPRLNALSVDNQWAFRMTANPVHTIEYPDEPPRVKFVDGVSREYVKKRRIPHETRFHQLAWLRENKAPHNGFEVLGEPATTRLVINKFSKTNGSTHAVTIASMTFDGFLKVTDPDAFRKALTNGIGHARAYGCGLMTIAPIPDHRIK
jgi:CRISPR system Cascade subunit CasE